MDGVPTPLRCFSECHSAEMFVDDGVETVTSVEQKKVECSIEEVISVYKQIHSLPQNRRYKTQVTYSSPKYRGTIHQIC
ncbi:protein farnesyltransferase subunit beta-like protein [Lates japonicus]|uniref:Protein farnesyltransferase subunit beta-like protein n=1 Tax=Lates japonicus TaxID=270547 RepID=A0AAD3M8H0_LATJO|nr:protein farnesyltransferase subunit beta-like protein [Lates japonicus]